MQIAYPFHLGPGGRVAHATPPEHLNQLIEQVLFTAPGERVNRPDFGCGLGRLVFEAASSEMVAVTQSLVQGALQQWLGDLIKVERVDVSLEDTALQVTIQYIALLVQQRTVATFSR